MHNLSEERIIKLEEWLKSVLEITSETISLYNENDKLTKWDSEYYNIVKYTNGDIKRDLSYKNTPSVMLHEIEAHMNSWGMVLKDIKKDTMYWSGITWLSIGLNRFHMDMIQIDGGGWITYQSDNFKHLIYERFIDESKKTNNISLTREIKLRSLLNTVRT